MNHSIEPQKINDTQQRILDAAIDCVKKWGLEKTSLNDIAKAAGVTRPTVYSYFESRDQVVRAALMRAALNFGQRLLMQMSKFTTPEDRLIESILFALEELPKEPYLAIITQTNVSPFVNQDALINEDSWKLTLTLFRQIFLKSPIAEHDLEEIAEIIARLVLSLLMTNGPRVRKRDEMRAFLIRRLLPVVSVKAGKPKATKGARKK